MSTQGNGSGGNGHQGVAETAVSAESEGGAAVFSAAPPPGPPPTSGPKLAPEKPPKQVVVAPDVTPPLPGGLSGAPA